MIDLRPRSSGPDRELVDGIPVYRIRTPAIPVLRALAYHARLAGLVLRLAGESDVAQLNHIGPALITAVPVLGAMRLPRLLCVWGSSMPGVGPFSKGLRHRLARRAARRVERVVALASVSSRWLARHGFDPSRLRVIPNGVVTDRFPPKGTDPGARAPVGWPAGGPTVVAVGRLVPAKGLDVLIDAWRSVSNRFPDARLVLVGDGPLRAATEKRIHELQADDRIHLLGARSDVPDLLRHADVYVSASRTEGMSNALLEAMCTGLAIVATRVGAAEDVIEDRKSGILVDPEDPRALADAMTRLLSDPELRARTADAARKRAIERFSIEAVVGQYLEQFREMRQLRLGGGDRRA